MTSASAPVEPLDLCVFVGRFQPVHAGHMSVIDEALKRAGHVLVVVGSANEPRSVRNPFTAEERIDMITQAYGSDPRLTVVALEDSNADVADWVARVEALALSTWDTLGVRPAGRGLDPAVALIGHAKDATSYYLNLFPNWGSIDVPKEHALCATTVRSEIFGSDAMIWPELLVREGKRWDAEDYADFYTRRARDEARVFLAAQKTAWEPDLTPPVVQWLEAFVDTPGYEQICGEYAARAKTRFDWRNAPYPPTFITTDAVVVHEDHVLLVRRNNYPGKGLWALPGGFLEQDESLLDGCLRELDEETAIDVPKDVLASRVVDTVVFSDPHRSSRGRTVTHGFLIELDGPRPRIKSVEEADNDETQRVAWVHLNDLRRDMMMEDHHAIVHKTAGGRRRKAAPSSGKKGP